MARKRHKDEDILRLLRETEPSLASGSGVATACRTGGFNDATYYTWRKRFGVAEGTVLSEPVSVEFSC